jgi:hypothetical protein
VTEQQMSYEELQELLNALDETPRRVRALVSTLREDESRWKPSGEEFSATENVCHLRDIEEEGYAVRIRKILSETAPVLNDLDGARLAAERDYNNQSMLEALDRFARARSVNVNALRDVSPESLSRTGLFAGVGCVTLGRLLSMMREHDLAHLEELETLRTRV